MPSMPLKRTAKCYGRHRSPEWRDSPNVADLDGDGEVEIVGMTFQNEVYCLNAKGQIRWRKKLRPELKHQNSHAYVTPILCDINGDQQMEILALTNGKYFDNTQKNSNKDTRANGIVFASRRRRDP